MQCFPGKQKRFGRFAIEIIFSGCIFILGIDSNSQIYSKKFLSKVTAYFRKMCISIDLKHFPFTSFTSSSKNNQIVYKYLCFPSIFWHFESIPLVRFTLKKFLKKLQLIFARTKYSFIFAEIVFDLFSLHFFQFRFIDLPFTYIRFTLRKFH